MWKVRQIRLDHMTIEIMCTDLCAIWMKSEGVTSKNMFYISRPPGGALKGRCEKCRAKVIGVIGVIGKNRIRPVI